MRFDGAAALANAKDDSRLMLENDNFITTIFVMLGDFTATTLATETILQDYDERLVLIACLDNTKDRTGKYAQDFVCHLRRQLLSQLLNYEYDPDSHNLMYVGDKMLEMDRARYWHKFEFKLLGRLGEEDGVDLNLSVFNKYVADWHSTNPIHDELLATDILEPLYYIPE
jgi:hypothetical protein